MKFSNPFYSTVEKRALIQKWILVHSYLYYELDISRVSDTMFDNNCKQLMDLTEGCRDTEETKYDHAFIGFDGSTGYDLFSKCKPELQHEIADIVAMMWHNEIK